MSTTESLDVEIIENGEYEFEKYSKALEDSNYAIGKKKLWKIGKTTSSPISNFLAIIDEQINYDNGRDIYTKYKVRGIIIENYKKLLPINITQQELESFNFVLNPEWKLDAIICAGQGNTDRMREVTQIISKNKIINKTVYSHLGFKRIGDELIYLYHNGFIGNSNNQIMVDVSEDKLERYCFTNKEYSIEEAITTSYSILDLAESSITIPLLATTYLAPIVSILQEVDINADYILWLEGKTGTRKSSIAAIALSHFGNFSRNKFVCSFRDTLNSIEKKSYIIKDSLNVIDDFNPETVGNRKLDIAEKIFAMYGDRAGRDRMSQNGMTLKSPYIARGLCIVTGESFPDVAQSRLARAIVTDVKSNSINLEKLTELQENKEKLAYAMKKYIEWVIQNETHIKDTAKIKMKHLQEKSKQYYLHGRTVESVSVMTIGFIFFLEFLESYGIISKQQIEELEKICYETLMQVAKKQLQDVEDSNPVRMFVAAIEQLYLMGKIYLKDYNEYDKTEYSNGVYVGLVDNKSEDELYYFFPDVIYKEIVKFYKEQNIKFPISKPTLWKYLDIEGFLYKTAKSDRRTVRRKIPNSCDEDVAVLPVIQHQMGSIYLKPRYYNID